MAFDPAYSDAISSIESGGKYDITGPVTKSGDRAYGKYQIMGANVPVWTKEILGQEMTPDQFLANPQAQEAVFQGKFGQYVDKYGPEGAAQAWFGGPGGVGKVGRKDVLGTSIGAYGQKFMAALGPNAELPTAPIGAPTASAQPQAASVNVPAPTVPAQSQPDQSSFMAQLPAEQGAALSPPPIFAGPRRPIDLSKLRAALQASGNRGFIFS